jgi:hypothetical protein
MANWANRLDACNIFLGGQAAGREWGWRQDLHKDDRDADDHVFVTSGSRQNYYADAGGETDKDDMLSSSPRSTRSTGGVGECLMGNRGTLIVHKKAFLYPEAGGSPRRPQWASARRRQQAGSGCVRLDRAVPAAAPRRPAVAGLRCQPRLP